MTEIVYSRAVDLLEAELGNEIVGLDVDDGKCFGFNEVAASVWRLLDQPRSADALQTALLDQYEVDGNECADELRALLDDLAAKGLVRTTSPSGANRQPTSGDGRPRG